MGLKATSMEGKTKTKTKTEVDGKSPSRYRDALLLAITSHVPQIKKVDIVGEEGDLEFTVSVEEMGISRTDYLDYKREILSSFFANVLGELMVRENIGMFAEILTNIDVDRYLEIVNDYQHYNFGMRIDQQNFKFSMHLSLVQRILTEDFERHVKVRS